MKIAQVIQADSWGDVTPEALERGIGGREGAMIRLATEWAKLGHEVTNFVPTKKAQRFFEVKTKTEKYFGPPDATPRLWKDPGFHEYVPLNLTKPMLASFPYDAVVAWECPSIYEDERIQEKQKVRLVHMQVAHFNIGEMEAAERYSTGVVALSEWAKEFLVSSGLQHKNLYVRPNGVSLDNYPIDPNFGEIPKHKAFVYSSSPDRGLEQLLELWPGIRKEHPDANLYVTYGVEKYVEQVRWSHNKIGEMALNIIEGMKQPGIVDLGKIGQRKLADLQRHACMWIYPADTIQATETGCITAIENMAAGNPCVMSDADCLASEFGEVACISELPFEADDYMEYINSILSDPVRYKNLSERGRKFAETREWSKIAPTWIDLFKEQANG
jgi:glycosyltransferase involved in cell wall biosynthesis